MKQNWDDVTRRSNCHCSTPFFNGIYIQPSQIQRFPMSGAIMFNASYVQRINNNIWRFRTPACIRGAHLNDITSKMNQRGNTVFWNAQ
jgi:hypothetical protein